MKKMKKKYTLKEEKDLGFKYVFYRKHSEIILSLWSSYFRNTFHVILCK